MSCEIAHVQNCDSKIMLLTEEQMREMESYVQKVVNAKTLVVGVPSRETVDRLRHNFESLMPLLEKMVRCLNSGVLDKCSDEELRGLATGMKERDEQMSAIYSGSLSIGLGAIEPFPVLLDQFKMYQERMQSQLEGIFLSLNGSFADLLEKSAKEVNVPA